jgi:FkbM family methyltransferase
MMFIIRYLSTDALVIDVGANIGSYAILAASCAPAGRVVAFEPDPAARGRLLENLQLNGLTNVTVRSEAVAQRVGEAAFSQGMDTVNRILAEDERIPGRTVQVTTLDTEFALSGHLQLCKLDTEGHEPAILRGSASLLKSGYPPVWIVEVNGASSSYTSNDREVIELFALNGYAPYQYDPVENRLGPRIDSRGASDNLIFIREDSLPDIRRRLARDLPRRFPRGR